MILKSLLTEQLRPKEFKQMILLDRISRLLPKGEITQNMLFYGVQGAGKTSLAKVLSKDYETLYINVSSDRGIDVLRDQINTFACTKSLTHNKEFKVIILDELDGATDLLFKALRATIEKFSKNIRFLATCNYISKIPNPIQSRFCCIDFTPKSKQEEEELIQKYKKRIETVSKKFKLNWENEDVIIDFIKKNFPDFRKMLSVLQELINSQTELITAENISNSSFRYIELFEFMTKKNSPENVYQFVISNYSGNCDNIFKGLSEDFPNWIFEKKKELVRFIPQILICVADWDFKHKSLIDENLGMLACIYNIMQIINV